MWRLPFVSRGVLQELDSVVTRARMFQYKPDGEVTFRMAQVPHAEPCKHDCYLCSWHLCRLLTE